VRRGRLFFALWPDAQTRQALQERVQTALGPLSGRRVEPENLHLTLDFLGTVEGERARCLLAGMAEIQSAPFSLTLDRLDSFRRARVIWLGVSHTPPALEMLVQHLRALRAACGLAPERRPFMSHLTLMRKVVSPPATTAVPPVTWQVERFLLVASRTLPEGARYEVVAERRLIAPPVSY